MARVSVVIPTYNRAKMVCEAIDSALQQTHADSEVIVVDDGSTDDTEKVLAERYGSKIVYLKQANAGSAAARNAGVKVATGEFIAFLDSDCTWEPTKNAKQLAFLEAHPEHAIVYCPHLPISESGEVIREIPKEKDYPSGQIFKTLYTTTHFVTNTTVMVRRAAVLEAGGFDESFRLCQDAELYLRITHAHTVGVLMEPLAYYRHHPGQISKLQTNKLVFLRKMYQKAYDLFRDKEPRVTQEMYRERMSDLDFKLARLYIREGKTAEAKQLIKEARKARPWDMRLWRYTFFLWLGLRPGMRTPPPLTGDKYAEK